MFILVPLIFGAVIFNGTIIQPAKQYHLDLEKGECIISNNGEGAIRIIDFSKDRDIIYYHEYNRGIKNWHLLSYIKRNYRKVKCD